MFNVSHHNLEDVGKTQQPTNFVVYLFIHVGLAAICFVGASTSLLLIVLVRLSSKLNVIETITLRSKSFSFNFVCLVAGNWYTFRFGQVKCTTITLDPYDGAHLPLILPESGFHVNANCN